MVASGFVVVVVLLIFFLNYFTLFKMYASPEFLDPSILLKGGIILTQQKEQHLQKWFSYYYEHLRLATKYCTD